ncbi:CCD73 protein, partial [Thinocorus orbignyianus]|nr:CCD73 protein [Thinocorus orbignyianus]
LQSPSETLLSIRLLDFKTSLLEAIEELRIRRETEINYEDQISKIVVEKQELEWQKETLQHQVDTLHQQNKEAMASFKKQLQARMFAVEEEKGKYQLAVETKEKEMDRLKEALKALQISKYTLEKKLNEMDQKLQMHLTAKEEHHKKLNEVERCYATIASQFGIVKGVHEKLEHSVQEAIQINKKLTSVNKRQETEISNLKEELKKVTTDLIRSKVTSQYRVGEENINLAAKEKQFQELQQKIRMETAISKKVQEENTHIKEEKLEILSSLQCVQELLQRITQTNARMESELNALKEEYQTLERDNELQREKAKENEEKFLNLQNEHEKALRTWKKDEENMRREIETIKNELNSLKGVRRHFEDYHPSQGSQHSEQVENVQVSVSNSCNSEIQAVQKENECMQSMIRKDCNFGHEEETEVKNRMDYSSSTEELQIERKNTLTDLQVFENSFKGEINVATPYEEKQREASPRNTLCTDTHLITQGETSEIPVTECKKAENLGTAHRVLLEEKNVNLEPKLQDSSEPLAPCHTQKRKVFLDSTDTIGVCKKKASEEIDCSKQESCNTDESTCTTADEKLNTIQLNRNVLTSEAPKLECEGVLCTEKNAVCERITDNNQTKELSFGFLSYTEENSQKEYQKRSLLDSGSYVGNGLHKTEQNLLNPSVLHRDKPPLKQIHIDAEDRNDDNNAGNMKRAGALSGAGVPAADAQNLPTASGDGATKECSDNMSLSIRTFNLCPLRKEKGANVDDMHSSQTEQDSVEQTGDGTNTCALNADDVSPVKADGLEIITYKKTPMDRISTDKVIPCKKVNEDIQIHAIKNGHSLEINNSTNNTLLKEKKDSLDSTVPGRKFAEDDLKESYSLPMRTSGNLVNISGRSSFDLSTSDKKAEKTPVYLNFFDFSSCSRVNQMRGQDQRPSASKEPSLSKEKLPSLVENTKVISKTQCQNLSENIYRRETGLGSTSFNRAADTLNTASIHRDPQGDPGEEWNAREKTFYDSSFPTEHVKEGFPALQQEQKSSPMSVTPVRGESALRDEDSCSTRNSIIQNQIEETEKFLNLERLHSARKRKLEE